MSVHASASAMRIDMTMIHRVGTIQFSVQGNVLFAFVTMRKTTASVNQSIAIIIFIRNVIKSGCSVVTENPSVVPIADAVLVKQESRGILLCHATVLVLYIRNDDGKKGIGGGFPSTKGGNKRKPTKYEYIYLVLQIILRYFS